MKTYMNEYSKKWNKAYRKTDKGKEAIRITQKNYRESERGRDYFVKYRQTETYKNKRQSAEYRKKESDRKKTEEYKEIAKKRYSRIKHTEKYKKMRSIYQAKRFKENISYKIAHTLRNSLERSLKANNIRKTNSVVKLLGISLEEFKKYLEKQFQPGMTLGNHGKWHIDHIKPITKYDLTKPGEVEKCFHYTNLQPLWATDNIKKSNKY